MHKKFVQISHFDLLPWQLKGQNAELSFYSYSVRWATVAHGLSDSLKSLWQLWVIGRAMVLGSFQCQGILLPWHMVGQGPAVLAAGAGRVFFFFFFFFSSCLSYLLFLMPHLLGDSWTYCGLSHYKPTVVVSYYWRRPGAIARSEACSLGMQAAPVFDPHVWHIPSWRLAHENISTAILCLPLIQEEQLSVTGERLCTKYW